MNKKFSPVSAAIVLCLIIASIFVALLYATQPKKMDTESSSTAVQEQSQRVTLSIEGVYEGKSVSFETGETLLLLLERLTQTDPKLQLSTKTYEMGTLIESLGGLTNGTDNKYWQFEVDGVAPMIGANAYVLRPGEEIQWLFKTSAF